LRLIRVAFPDRDYPPGGLACLRATAPHALAVAGHTPRRWTSSQGRPPGCSARAAWASIILNNPAAVLHDQGDLDGAGPLVRRALAIREARLGPHHPLTAASLTYLGDVLHAQGDLEAARALHERALAIFQARLGQDHPATRDSLSTLAAVRSELDEL
jgi:tetratricopeptide (TPR) repeat protein